MLGATSFAAIYQIALPRPSIATPNARVADAFSAIPLNVTTVLTTVGAALAADAGVAPRALDPRAIQRALLKQGAYLSPSTGAALDARAAE